MNKYQKSILLTAANIAIIGFSAIAATTATVAWFQFSDGVTAEGMSIECQSVDRSVEWNILRYDEEVKSGVLSHNEDDFHLPSYDQYITTKNIYSNVILAATVITPTGLSAVEQVYVDITCTGGLKDGEGKILALTSNVCQFKVTVYAYENPELGRLSCNTAVAQLESRNPTAEQADTAYKTATTFFNGTNSGAVSFVDVHNNTATKDKDNKITVIPRFNSNGETVTTLYCYLECSYNPKLVEHYISQLDNSSVESQEISLQGDIDEIKFRFGEKYTGAYVQVENQADLTADSDYMIAYDDYTVALDGSGTRPTHYNDTEYTNYLPVEINRNRIAATEVTHNSDWSYTETQNIRSRAGFNIGATQAANRHNGLVASQANNYANDLTYQYDGIVSAYNGGKYLSYDTNVNKTRFDYWDDVSTAGVENIKFYKYSNSEAANSILDFISLQFNSCPTSFVVGDVFSHAGMTVTAHYTDGSTSPVENYSVWTGYNMNLAGRQQVNVAYTEDGITANEVYNIDVTSGPTIKCVPSALKNQYVGGSAKIRVDKFFFLDDQGNDSNVTYTWSINDSTVASIEPNAAGDECMVYFSKAGPAKITVHAEDEWGNSDTTIVQVTVVGQQLDVTAYKKVKQNSELTSGEYLIVYEGGGEDNIMFDGARGELIDVANNYNPVSITNETVASSDSVVAGAFIFSYASANSSDKKFFIETKGGVRIGASSNTNTITLDASHSDDSLYNTITIDESDENFSAHIVASGGSILRYNKSSNQRRFRYYKSSTYTSQQPVTLYKKSADNTNLKVREIREDPMNPLPKQFSTRSNFSITGGAVQARFNNGTLQNVTSQCSFTGYDMFHAGRQTVTVSYTLNGDTVKFTYEIQVIDPTLTGLSLELTGDAKIYYETGETFSTQGINVIASYDNFSTQEVSSMATFTGFPDDPSQLGTFTITVTYGEGNIQFSKTYEITISPATNGFKLCRNANELVAGDHIVITAADSNVALSTEQKSNNRGEIAITKNGDNLPYVDGMGVFEVANGENGGFAFHDMANGGYLTTASSSANYLRLSDTITANASWSVSITGGEATVVGLGNYTRKNMRYNKSSKLFACYASGQLAISIYRWHGTWTGFEVPLESISTQSPLYNLETGMSPLNLATEIIYTPASATNKNVTYQIDASSDPGTISIEGNGVVYGTQAGFATIIIISEENNTISTVVNIRVQDPFIAVTDVVIDSSPVSLRIGESSQLLAHVVPANATMQNIAWISENKDCVTVDSTGLVTAVAGGQGDQSITVTIYAYSAQSDQLYDTVTVTVLVGEVIHVQEINITTTIPDDTLTVGDTLDLQAAVSPANATYTNYTWSIDPDSEDCFTLTADGHLEATAPGIGIVVVTSEDGGFTDSIIFEVVPGSITTPIWNLVTNTNQLSDGAQVIIAAQNYSVAAGEQASNNIRSTSITKSADGSQLTDIQSATVFTLGRDTDWTFSAYGSNTYLSAAGAKKNNYLRAVASLGATTNFSISIDGNGAAVITCTDSGTTKNLMRYNSSSNPSLFSCYASGQQPIVLYVNEGTSYTPSAMHLLKPIKGLDNIPLSETNSLNTYFLTLISDLDFKNKELNVSPQKHEFRFAEKIKEFTTLKINNLLERRIDYEK